MPRELNPTYTTLYHVSFLSDSCLSTFVLYRNNNQKAMVGLDTVILGIFRKILLPDEKYMYTVSQKNDNDVLCYNFKAHQPILIIFGRDIAE